MNSSPSLYRYLIGGVISTEEIKTIEKLTGGLTIYIGIASYEVSKNVVRAFKNHQKIYPRYFYSIKEVQKGKHNGFLSIHTKTDEYDALDDLEYYLTKEKKNYIMEAYFESTEYSITLPDWGKVIDKWEENIRLPFDIFFRYRIPIDSYYTVLYGNQDGIPLVSTRDMENYISYNLTIKELKEEIEKIYSPDLYLDRLEIV
jgi:hypothetical protein